MGERKLKNPVIQFARTAKTVVLPSGRSETSGRLETRSAAMAVTTTIMHSDEIRFNELMHKAIELILKSMPWQTVLIECPPQFRQLMIKDIEAYIRVLAD